MKLYPTTFFLFLLLVTVACVRNGTPVSNTGLDVTASPTGSVSLVSPGITPSVAPTKTPLPSTTPTIQPTLTREPTVAPCWHQGGQIELVQLRSQALKLPMDYRIYLPPCYAQDDARRYPVLYLIHGQTFTDDQWDRLGVDETADALIAAGEMVPFIIVMPRDRSWEQPVDDKFGEVLVTELIPLVDRQYRTLPDRAHRAIGGLSRGAGWAIHLGLSRWELFGAVGAHSLPIFWSDTGHIRAWLDAIPEDALPRIYLDIGEKDRPSILNSARWFEALLSEKDIPHEWHLFPGYHEEAYWQAHVTQYLLWYTANW